MWTRSCKPIRYLSEFLNTMSEDQKMQEGAGDPCASILAELEDAQKKAAEYLAGWQRATADYHNLQKQVAAERVEVVKYANEYLLLELLPALDHAQEALAQAPALEGALAQWVAGVRHVFDGLWSVLKAHGLEVMPDTLGATFDPTRHESVGVRKEEGREPGFVLAVERPGYLLHGRVLRPAQVIISD